MHMSTASNARGSLPASLNSSMTDFDTSGRASVELGRLTAHRYSKYSARFVRVSKFRRDNSLSVGNKRKLTNVTRLERLKLLRQQSEDSRKEIRIKRHLVASLYTNFGLNPGETSDVR
jgi:hypothetical protein